MPVEHIPNGDLGYLEIQLDQFALDLAVPPARVFLGQADDQVLEILADARSSPLTFVMIGPLAANKFLMPAEYGLGLENANGRSQLICGSRGAPFQFGG